MLWITAYRKKAQNNSAKLFFLVDVFVCYAMAAINRNKPCITWCITCWIFSNLSAGIIKNMVNCRKILFISVAYKCMAKSLKCECCIKLASSHPCYLHLSVFSYTYTVLHYTVLLCWKRKSCYDRCFPQQSRPQVQTTIQYITRLF